MSSGSQEQGLKWWIRYVIVPIIGSGGVIAIIVALLNSVKTPQPIQPLTSTPTSVSPTQIPIEPTTVPPPPTCVSSLTSPQANAILDNGRRDGLDNIVWDFDWSDCPGASEYHLYVIGPNTTKPKIDNSAITSSSYQYISAGSFIAEQSRSTWTWRVRARVNGQWGEWSETRVFNVEPVDTDPSSP